MRGSSFICSLSVRFLPRQAGGNFPNHGGSHLDKRLKLHYNRHWRSCPIRYSRRGSTANAARRHLPVIFAVLSLPDDSRAASSPPKIPSESVCREVRCSFPGADRLRGKEERDSCTSSTAKRSDAESASICPRKPVVFDPLQLYTIFYLHNGTKNVCFCAHVLQKASLWRIFCRSILNCRKWFHFPYRSVKKHISEVHS